MLEQLGVDRVVSPPWVLPQMAEVLDAAPPGRAHELVVAVDRLVIDAASARQLVSAHGSDGLGAAVDELVKQHGKLHNPVTGSGGIACGAVSAIGDAHPLNGDMPPGARIATLVSLTLTPLRLDRVLAFDQATHQLRVEGQAFLSPSAAVAELPDDLELEIALAAFDVAGAPSQVAPLAAQARTVFIVGAGTAGLLSAAAARDANPDAKIVLADASEAACQRARSSGIANHVLKIDATDGLAAARALHNAAGGLADLCVSVADAPGCEASCYLSTAPDGTILFFSMATSFTAAALGAEGVGSNVQMLIGNGFSPDRGAYAVDLIRRHPALRRALGSRNGTEA